MQSIQKWLAELGMSEHLDAFVENEVDWTLLCELTNDDLKDLGVAKLSHRKKILAAIQAVNSDAQELEGTSVSPRAERRQLTVMFCDIVGSTALSARVDPEELRDTITRFQNLVAGAVTRFDGQIAKYMGDGVLCYFGWPKAHEEDAQRAVSAALRIMEGLKRDDGGLPVQARIGVSTGLVVVGDLIGSGAAQEEAVVGETPNIAARLQGIAEPGQIVISGATRQLLGRYFSLTDIGAHELKGVPDSVPAFVVVGERRVESRFEAQRSGALRDMIGRSHELGLILDRWRQAKTGSGQVVTITGEPGIGKSRVTKALADEIAGDDHVRINYQCSPYHAGSPLYPAIQQFTIAAGIKDGDENEVRLDKLETLLESGDVRLIAALLGLDVAPRYDPLALSPTQQRADTLDALVDELIALSRSAPVLFVVEDAHWIDATTLELIDLAQNRIAGKRVLILVTGRPVFQHAFSGEAAATKLELNRLGRAQITEIVRAMAGDRELPERLLNEIYARSDGVPLYAEELTRTVLAAGADADGSNGLGPAPPLAVPASLSDSLMARLDRSKTTKEVAQIAACIGREFSYKLLAKIVPETGDQLDEALDELIGAELIFRRGSARDGAYSFKHALVSDVAYQSLLKSRRRDIHASIAEILGQDETTPPELIARHLTGAGQPAQAAPAWERAGQSALARAAGQEAIQHFSAAVEQLDLLPDARDRNVAKLRILTQLGSTLLNVEGWASAGAISVHRQAKELADHLDTSPERISALAGIWLFNTGRGKHEESAKISEELADIARKSGEPGLLLQAHHAYWPNQMILGKSHAAADTVDGGLELYDEKAHEHHRQIYMGHDPAVCGHSIGAHVKWVLGRVSEAEEHSRRALAHARQIGHMGSLIHSMIVQGTWLSTVGDGERLLELSEELGSLADTHHLKAAMVNARLYRGWARTNLGDHKAGLEDLTFGVEAWQKSGARIFLGQRLSMLGSAQALCGDHAAAADSFKAAFEALAKTDEQQFAPEIHLRYGQVLIAADAANKKQAERAMATGMASAKQQAAPAHELRVALSLGPLQAETGHRDAGADTLRAAIASFPEGQTSPDLDAARALLRELA